MVEVIEGLPGGVIGITATGTIEQSDYSETLTPLLDAAVAEHGKVGMLIVMGPEFEGFSAAAAFEDTKLGFAHGTAFRRLALVTDNEWIRTAAMGLMYLLPGKSKGFSLTDLEAAKEWVAADD